MFNKVESYKHKYAIEILRDWIENHPYLLGIKFKLTTVTDIKFSINDKWAFVPDLVVYCDDFVYCIFEVEHKHPVDWKKLLKIQYYQYKYKEYFDLYEINAEWILSQVGVPYKLNYIKFSDIRLVK